MYEDSDELCIWFYEIFVKKECWFLCHDIFKLNGEVFILREQDYPHCLRYIKCIIYSMKFFTQIITIDILLNSP